MLDLAIEHAKANPVVKLPRLGAIICLGGKIIAKGWNSYKTHPLAAKFCRHPDAIHLHAELDAVVRAVRAGYDLRGATMYVARVFRSGEPALAKPCPGCERAIAAFGIKEVEWTK